VRLTQLFSRVRKVPKVRKDRLDMMVLEVGEATGDIVDTEVLRGFGAHREYKAFEGWLARMVKTAKMDEMG
jgi:predicted ArsR family transcriptional regulator